MSHAADHVGVAVDVLRYGMDDDVESQRQRSLHVGCGERIVGNTNQPALFCNSGDGCQVHQFQQRIGRSFDPDHPRVRPDRRFERRRVGRVDIGEIEPGRAPAHAFEEAVGSAVEIVAHDDVRTMVEQLEHRGDGRQSRGEGEAGLPVFQSRPRSVRRRIASDCASGRNRNPCARRATLLDVSAGGIDRRHDRPGRRIGRLSGVDGARAELVRHLSFRRR